MKSTAIGLALAVLVLVPAAASAGPQDTQYVREGDTWYRIEPTGRFLVNPEVVSARFLAPLASFEDFQEAVGSPAEAGLPALELVRSNRLGIHDLRIADGSDVLAAVAALRATGLVEFAEENTYGQYVGTPNDPSFNQQYALVNTGQTGGTPDADIDADAAWDVTVGIPSIAVGILDSGTYISHVDLAANVWTNAGEVPNNNQDDDQNGYIDDVFGWDFYNDNNSIPGPFYHGTAVAGVVAATTNNGIGIAGVAGGFNGGDGCRVMCLGVGDFFPDGAILDDAIIYAADNGARVITMSLSVGPSTAITNALSYAWDQNDVFVDCAAGNNSGGVSYPANNPDVVAVPATNDNDDRASFSNTGPENWVAAPGEDIYMLDLNNGYTTASGTSFAAPHVAGLAGLIFSLLPNTSNESVKQILADTADDIESPGFDNQTGWGRINAHSAVLEADANDCNGNGVYDPEDIANGTSTDSDGDGVPDECTGGCPPPTNYCLTAANSVGPGATIGYSGSQSVSQNDLVLESTGLPASQTGVFYYGPNQIQIPFGEGWRCVGGTTYRLPTIVIDSSGDASYSLDITNPPGAGGQIQVGDTWNFQFWYRDPSGGPSTFNLSDALEITFCN